MPEAKERTFTEAEHQALLESAVGREVATATETAQATISTLEQRVDVLEAEKSAAEQRVSEVTAEFTEFQENLEQEKAVEECKAERVERVKASAPHLNEEYFSEARIQRWAEMADDAFSALVEDFEEASIAGMSPEQAKQIEGLEGEARSAKLTELLSEKAGEKIAMPARETAAFGGGKSPVAPDKAKTSTFGTFLAASRGERVSAE
jgi:murein L,D-transpeptidase YcbB/YkuD